MSIQSVFVIACSIHSTHDGEIGVYEPPGGGGKNGALNNNVSGDSDVVTSTEDGSDGWPDVPLKTLQDSGQCIGNEYPAMLQEPRPLAAYVVIDATSADLRAAPIWSMVLIQTVLMSPEKWGISSLGVKLIRPDSQCDSSFAEPTFPIVAIPENLVPLMTTLASSVATLSTVPSTAPQPILPALKGAIQYARSYAQSNQDSDVVIWLLTNDLPNGCDSTLENVSQVAADALSPPDPIATHVIGINDSEVVDLQALDQIAQNGGTEKATLVDLVEAEITLIGPLIIAVGPSDPSSAAALAFLDTMNERRRSALLCGEYALPTALQDGQVNLDLINMYFVPVGGQKTVVHRVKAADRCDPVKGGWFYNEKSNHLIACDKTCDTFKATPGEVSIELGCPSIML